MLHALPRMHTLLLTPDSMVRNGPRCKSLWHNADGVFRVDRGKGVPLSAIHFECEHPTLQRRENR